MYRSLRIAMVYWLLGCGMLMTAVVSAQPTERDVSTGLGLVGGTQEYIVKPEDSLTRISARLAAPSVVIAKDNQLRRPYVLTPGARLVIRNRHIVPMQIDRGIVINIPQRMLYFYEQGVLRHAFPVTVGKAGWETPVGNFKVLDLQLNKTWVVPKSIQQEMRREGKQVRTHVPAGPDNPLGKYWVGISWEGYGIHSTIAPASIYGYLSHGCVRVHPDDIAILFSELSLGVPVKMIYQPVLLFASDSGEIYLEIHRDVYNKFASPLVMVRQLANATGLSDRMDWTQVLQIVKDKDGLAHEVSLRPATEKIDEFKNPTAE